MYCGWRERRKRLWDAEVRALTAAESRTGCALVCVCNPKALRAPRATRGLASSNRLRGPDRRGAGAAPPPVAPRTGV